MLGPRYFPRWKERHQVKFTFGNWVTSDSRVDFSLVGGKRPLDLKSTSGNDGGKRVRGDKNGDLEKQFFFKILVMRNYIYNNNKMISGGFTSRAMNSREALIFLPPVYSFRMQQCPETKAYFFPAEGTDYWMCAFPAIDHQQCVESSNS